MNHLELCRSTRELNSQPHFFRFFNFPIPKNNLMINPLLIKNSSNQLAKVVSSYDMIENFLRVTKITVD